MSIFSTIDNYEEFSSFQHPSREEVFLYIDQMYNKESDLIANYEDIDMRKKVAARNAGMDVSQPWVMAIMKNSDEQVNRLIDCYITQIQGSIMLKMLVTAEEYFSEIQEAINMKMLGSGAKLNVGDEKVMTTLKGKGELIALSEVTADRIKKYRHELYPKNLGYNPAAPTVRKKARPENA